MLSDSAPLEQGNCDRRLEPGHKKRASAASGGGPHVVGGATPDASDSELVPGSRKAGALRDRPTAGGEGRGAGAEPLARGQGAEPPSREMSLTSEPPPEKTASRAHFLSRTQLKGRLRKFRAQSYDPAAGDSQAEVNQLLHAAIRKLSKCESRLVADVAPNFPRFVEFMMRSDASSAKKKGYLCCKRDACPTCLAAKSGIRTASVRLFLRKKFGDIIREGTTFHLITLTASHSMGTVVETLDQIFSQLDRFAKAFDARSSSLSRSRKRAQSKEESFVEPGPRGYLSHIEATLGKNGMHVHAHIFLVLDESDSSGRTEARRLKELVSKIQRDEEHRCGKKLPKHVKDASWKVVDSDSVVDYVLKGSPIDVSAEATSSATKTSSRSIFDIKTLEEAIEFARFSEAIFNKRLYRKGGIFRDMKKPTSEELQMLEDEKGEDKKYETLLRRDGVLSSDFRLETIRDACDEILSKSKTVTEAKIRLETLAAELMFSNECSDQKEDS